MYNIDLSDTVIALYSIFIKIKYLKPLDMVRIYLVTTSLDYASNVNKNTS